MKHMLVCLYINICNKTIIPPLKLRKNQKPSNSIIFSNYTKHSFMYACTLMYVKKLLHSGVQTVYKLKKT